ncbi:hypothetical protein EDEG_02716 [Edhazardia aedis USNM 41457]|uniref:Uncharacterized protein n=1 Tax=Edhazardia aedis (strain USNM 41457) TaxID=1003232 RepID=J9DNC9_EDHAE|nr:hypothetical protein EDEG_02716 [Edhazardia aedis USNM 41457]|eukprot:EJW02892.1 hypothetical protein EDEG_02716 [Edhazardia aedis USNM 41457]
MVRSSSSATDANFKEKNLTNIDAGKINSYEIQKQINHLCSEHSYYRFMCENFYFQANQEYQKWFEIANNAISGNQSNNFCVSQSILPNSVCSMPKTSYSDHSQQSSSNSTYPNPSSVFSDYNTENMQKTIDAGSDTNISGVFQYERNQNDVDSQKSTSVTGFQRTEIHSCPEYTVHKFDFNLLNHEHSYAKNYRKNNHFVTQRQDTCIEPISTKKHTHTISEIHKDDVLYEFDIENIDEIVVEVIDEGKAEDTAEDKAEDTAEDTAEDNFKDKNIQVKNSIIFKNTQIVFLKLFPCLKNQLLSNQINLIVILEKKFENFANDKLEIIEQCKIASKAYKNLEENTNDNQKLENCYIETLKIFIDYTKFKHGIIQIKPLWKILSLFYPEILGFVNSFVKNSNRVISSIHNQKNNITSDEIFCIRQTIFKKKSSYLDNELDNNQDFLKLEAQYQKNDNLENSMNLFLKIVADLFTNFISEARIYENKTFFKDTIGENILEDFQNIFFPHFFTLKEKNNDAFLHVIYSFPAKLLNKETKRFYLKVIQLKRIYESNISHKAPFFVFLLMHCVFDLSDDLKEALEKHINKHMIEIYRINGFNTEYRKKNFFNTAPYQHVKRAIFETNIESIIKCTIEKCEIILGKKSLLYIIGKKKIEENSKDTMISIIKKDRSYKIFLFKSNNILVKCCSGLALIMCLL